MKYYNDLEVKTLIDELTEAALHSIEQAAGEATKAAFLQSLERESKALHETQKYKKEIETLRQAEIKNNFIIGAVCFIAGLAAGTTATILIIK